MQRLVTITCYSIQPDTFQYKYRGLRAEVSPAGSAEQQEFWWNQASCFGLL